MDRHGVLNITKIRYHPNRPKTKNPVKIQDVSFHDGHQSLFKTCCKTEDILTVAKEIDKIGFYSIEVWGGITIDVNHCYLIDDPWKHIRELKKYIKKTPFSILLKGQKLLGDRLYPDDVVEAFIQKLCDNGIDIFRVYDAMNDLHNLETVIKVIKKNKKHFQGTICYSLTEMRMGGEVYNLDYYIKKAKELVKMGADTISIKDKAGLMAPYDIYNLIKALKQTIKMPIHIHCHFTSGMGDLVLLKAIEAGVDIIDTCMAPYAYRTSHPAIEPLVVTLIGTDRDTRFDIKKLNDIDKKIEKIIPKYQHLIHKTNKKKFSIIDPNISIHQMPIELFLNIRNQLKSMGKLEKFNRVLKILPKVRKDLGCVPLVNPISHIVGIQAINNVLFDKIPGQYSNITEQVKDLCFGLYGETPHPINPKIQAKALKYHSGKTTQIKRRVGDILTAELPSIKEKVKGLAKNLEDILIAAIYPVIGPQFLKWKYGKEEIPDDVKPKTFKQIEKEKNLIEKALKGQLEENVIKEGPEKSENIHSFNIFVNGEYFKIEVDG